MALIRRAAQKGPDTHGEPLHSPKGRAAFLQGKILGATSRMARLHTLGPILGGSLPHDPIFDHLLQAYSLNR